MTLNQLADMILDSVKNVDINYAVDVGDVVLFVLMPKGGDRNTSYLIDPLIVDKQTGKSRRFFPPSESKELLDRLSKGKKIYPKDSKV